MIEISLGKMVLLALIALIVLGPEKLPGAARTAGALLRRVRGGWDNVRAEVERELEIEQIKRAAREAAGHAEAAQTAIKEGVKDVHKPLSEMAADVAMMAKSGDVMTERAPATDAGLAEDAATPAGTETGASDDRPSADSTEPTEPTDLPEMAKPETTTKTSHDDA